MQPRKSVLQAPDHPNTNANPSTTANDRNTSLVLCFSAPYDKSILHPARAHAPIDHVVSTCPCHITAHLLPPVGSLGFCDFSISAIMRSKALDTFSLYRALASVHTQRNSSAIFFPSSAVTCRCSGRKSLLLPTMTRGTQSAPYMNKGEKGVSEWIKEWGKGTNVGSERNGRRRIPSDSGSCP